MCKNKRNQVKSRVPSYLVLCALGAGGLEQTVGSGHSVSLVHRSLSCQPHPEKSYRQLALKRGLLIKIIQNAVTEKIKACPVLFINNIQSLSMHTGFSSSTQCILMFFFIYFLAVNYMQLVFLTVICDVYKIRCCFCPDAPTLMLAFRMEMSRIHRCITLSSEREIKNLYVRTRVRACVFTAA